MQVGFAWPHPPATHCTPSRHARSSARRTHAMVVCGMPDSYQVRDRSGVRKCRRNAAQLIPQAHCHAAVESVCVCVAITVHSPPSVSEEPAWSLVKECSQTCCRDFASRVICTAFLSLCSRKEHLAYGYLDALQKNKALHYEKGSHSLKNKKNKKCKKSCKM